LPDNSTRALDTTTSHAARVHRGVRQRRPGFRLSYCAWFRGSGASAVPGGWRAGPGRAARRHRRLHRLRRRC
jgi:hypothetical protein